MAKDDRTKFRDRFTELTIRAFHTAFDLPLDRLGWLREFMLKPNADHFSYAYACALDGMVVFLLTNLRDVFHMETDVDLQEQLRYAYFRHDDPEAYFLLKMNPIVNETLKFASPPHQTQISDEKYKLIRRADTMQRAQTLEEIAALNVLRLKGNRTVTFEFVGEQLARAVIERTEPPDADLATLMREDPYQTITVQIGDNNVRHVGRKLSRKLPKSVDRAGKRLPLFIRIVGRTEDGTG